MANAEENPTTEEERKSEDVSEDITCAAKPSASASVIFACGVCGLAIIVTFLVGIYRIEGASWEQETRTLVQRVVTTAPLVDGRNDFLFNLRNLTSNKLSTVDVSDLDNNEVFNNASCPNCRTDLRGLLKGRIGLQVWVASSRCDSQFKDDVQETLEQIDLIYHLIYHNDNVLGIISEFSDVYSIFHKGQISCLIGLSGGHVIESSLSVLRMFHELGARSMALAQDCSTPWADAVKEVLDGQEKKDTGLKKFGEAVVKEMNRLGMIVDLAGASPGTIARVFSITRAPVIFSCAGASNLSSYYNNVPDDVLPLLKANGGIVMVPFAAKYLTNTDDASIKDVIAHINYIRDAIGPDHVGLGSYFDGPLKLARGLDELWKYDALFEILSKQPEWNEENLLKLASLNFIRVFQKVEEVSKIIQSEHTKPYRDLVPEELLKEHGVGACMADWSLVQPSS